MLLLLIPNSTCPCASMAGGGALKRGHVIKEVDATDDKEGDEQKSLTTTGQHDEEEED